MAHASTITPPLNPDANECAHQPWMTEPTGSHSSISEAHNTAPPTVRPGTSANRPITVNSASPASDPAPATSSGVTSTFQLALSARTCGTRYQTTNTAPASAISRATFETGSLARVSSAPGRSVSASAPGTPIE